MSKINRVTVDVSVAMPPDFSELQAGRDIHVHQESIKGLKMLTEALVNPEREFIVVNGY